MISSYGVPEKVCLFLTVRNIVTNPTAGDIHIWDRDSAALLRCICPPTPSMLDLTCIAWNYATDEPFSFATGSHDGAVCLWSTSAPLEPDAKSESSYGHTEGDQICTDL